MTKIITLDHYRRNNAAARAEDGTQADANLRRSSDGTGGASDEAPFFVQSGEADITVTVVVPTRGRPQLLNRCIASLVLQRFDPKRFEIVIVDDGPGEETREVVTGWAAHTAEKGPQVTYIPSMGPHGPAAARNHGWRAARGRLIAFTDDDTIARTDWLLHGVRALEGGADVVCGRVIMPLTGTPTDYELDAKHLETAEFVTANCLCRRKVIEDLAGFDERFRLAWREDSDLHFRLLEYCANIVREPKAVVMHPVRPAAWGVSLSQVKKVQFDALLYKKHPRMYRRKIRARPRWDFYVIVCALLFFLAALATASEVIATVAGLTWLAGTGRFFATRLRGTSKSPSHVLEMLVTSVLIPPLAVFWRAVGAIRYRVGFL